MTTQMIPDTPPSDARWRSTTEMTRSENHRRAGLARPRENQPPVSIRAVDWRRLVAYLRPYWRRMALAIVALLLSSGFGLAFPLVIVRLLDSVTKSGDFGSPNSLALGL